MVQGFPIHAVHYASTLPGVVNDPCIIASATGVPCIFYGNFARYLASQGTPTLCFDYRFIGNSFPLNVDLKNQEERIAALKEGKGTTISGDYVLDMESAVDYLASEYPNRKIVALTHSVGGHVLPLMEPRYLSLISRAITLGCMNPSFEGSSVGQAREESCALAIERTIQDGYWPARSLGQGHDLPSGVLIEWFNWMKYTTYWAYGNEDRLQRYRTPTYSIALFDDVIAEGKPEMTDMILKSLPNAPATRVSFDPAKMVSKVFSSHSRYTTN